MNKKRKIGRGEEGKEWFTITLDTMVVWKWVLTIRPHWSIQLSIFSAVHYVAIYPLQDARCMNITMQSKFSELH